MIQFPRRRFLSTSSVAAAALALNPAASFAGPTAKKTPKKPVLMKLGCQTAPTNDQHLKYLARYGVRNICGYPVIADGRLYATVEELQLKGQPFQLPEGAFRIEMDVAIAVVVDVRERGRELGQDVADLRLMLKDFGWRASSSSRRRPSTAPTILDR